MALAMSPTREKYPLSEKKIIKKTLNASSIFLVILIVFGIFFLLFSLYSPDKKDTGVFTIFLAVLFVCVIGMIACYFYQRWYFATYYYDLTPDHLIIKKGTITPSEITIPYERLQDVYVDQDIMDRIFGLYDVHVSSATVTSGIQAHIDGLEKPAADGLKQELLSIISKKLYK